MVLSTAVLTLQFVSDQGERIARVSTGIAGNFTFLSCSGRVTKELWKRTFREKAQLAPTKEGSDAARRGVATLFRYFSAL